MNRKVNMPLLKFSHLSRQTRGIKQGKGIGAVLLDGGMGGQSSYESVDNYMNTTNAPSFSGRGLGSLRNKMENLIIKPSYKKPKNINFNL
jgi:hypothetical protein